MSRSLVFVALLLLLAGCDQLDTRYGLRDEGSQSVNGAKVLAARVAALGSVVDLPRLSTRAESRDLLIHLARDSSLPDEDAMTWIQNWLEGGDGRQFVLILRDGNIAPWLCRRWAAEARAEAARVDGDRRSELEAMAVRFEQRAVMEEEPRWLGEGGTHDALFRLRPLPTTAPVLGPAGPETGPLMPPDVQVARADRHPERFSGLIDLPTPEMFTHNTAVVADLGRPLIAADGETWALEVPLGKSRLVVLANAMPVLDGAQVEPRARRLLAALMEHVAAWHRTKSDPAMRIAWIGALSGQSESDPEPPNLLAMLFGKPPFSYAAFHLLALTLIFVAWKATWIGRTEARPDRRIERFARHVEALADHLRRDRAVGVVLAAIAKALGRSAPERVSDPDIALHLARELHRSNEPTPAPAEDPT